MSVEYRAPGASGEKTAMNAPARLPTFVINRGKDKARWDSVCKSVADFPVLDMRRIEAIDGHAADFDVKTALPDIFANLDPIPDDVRFRGMAAVSMSHALCWREIARGDSYFGLILEDDVQVRESINALQDVLIEGKTPDIMFVNPRMNRHLKLAFPGAEYATWTPVDAILKNLAENLPSEKFEAKNFSKAGVLTAPGGDAYVLTRPAARKLLEFVSKKKNVSNELTSYAD